ncbi:MAG: hypothetical protein ACW96S_02735 [Promethearchaeota archaeon]|jgi:hypothetical protein
MDVEKEITELKKRIRKLEEWLAEMEKYRLNHRGNTLRLYAKLCERINEVKRNSMEVETK